MAYITDTGGTAGQLVADDQAAAARCPTLKGLEIDRRGGVRIEYVSPDTTLVKIHSTARFRSRTSWRLACSGRFEIINEFLARKVSDVPQYVLREGRIFGDSPRLLERAEILGLVRFVLDRSALMFQTNDRSRLSADDLLTFVGTFFGSTDLPDDSDDSDNGDGGDGDHGDDADRVGGEVPAAAYPHRRAAGGHSGGSPPPDIHSGALADWADLPRLGRGATRRA